MTDPLQPPESDQPKDVLGDEIGHRAARKQRARDRRARSAWFGLGMFGLVGWSVAIPTILGIILGMSMDAHWPSHHSWTLTMLITGVILGCLNAWYWIKQESRHD